MTELKAQLDAITRLAGEAAALKVEAKAAAIIALQTEILTTLVKRGLLSPDDVMMIAGRMEAASAIYAPLAPETGKELGDVALQLRHTFTKADQKPN